MSTTHAKETKPFQTEVRQLLDLMIHSLYGNKEVFLRELISNASDALDKLRFAALSDGTLYEGDSASEVRLHFDKEARTITISDNGIGMDWAEVEANIGTIARSGTKQFFASLSGDQAKDSNLIGQFGVGFYSAFIVSDRVVLITRKAGTDEAVRWESSGDGAYTIEPTTKAKRGTEVILHLREGDDEFLNNWKLRTIVQKFSDHISWPILMVADAPDAPDAEDGDEETPEGEEKPKDKTPKEVQWETVNRASALWTRSKGEITEEEHEAFYKHISHDFEGPLTHHHARLEGKYEYTVLFYIPKRPPFDLWDREQRTGVRLYVRRVFIMEGHQELMPRYLRFVRGVLDSADLPLNVSREILQQSPMVDAIRKGAVGKVFTMLEDLANNDAEKYKAFWKNFGPVIKEGVIEDYSNKDRLAKLLRFASSTSGPEQTVSLADYVGRMKEGQQKIFYATGETYSAACNSPHLEIFRRKGIEVLLLHDRIDEWLSTHLHEFEGKSLQAVSKGSLELDGLEDEAEKESLKQAEGAFADLVKRVKDSLGDEVKEVRVSHRLTDSPSCLVGGDYDMSPSMERLLKSAGQDVPVAKRTLELNPTHPLVQRLQNESDDNRFKDWSTLLYEQALLSEGGTLPAPAEFVRRMNQMLLALSNV